LKLWVIVATDGRVQYTGAAGAFFTLGLYSLLVGCTGLGLRLAMNQELAVRVVAALGAAVAFFVSFAIFSVIGYAIVAAGRLLVGDVLPRYLLEEGGIFISAVVWLVVGKWLVVGVMLRGTPHGTRGTAGSQEAEPQPRMR